MEKRDPLSFRWSTKPGNSQYVVILDSTRGLINGAGAAVASGSAYLVPGTLRGRWAGAAVRYSALCTTQNVTAYEQILTGQAGTAADWEPQSSAGTQTVTAATTLVREWKPMAADFSLVFLAGGTGPGALTVEVVVYWADNFGG